MSENQEHSAAPHSLRNFPVEDLKIETVKNAFVTRSMLVGTFKGIHSAALIRNIRHDWKRKFNFIFLGSLVKNKLKVLDRKDYIFCLHLWATGYHHWLSEIAPKFILFENELRKGKILMPARIPGFIGEFLEMFDFENVEFYEDNCFVRELKIITNPNSGHYDKDYLLKFRDAVFRKVSPVKRDSPKKIYISRKNARARRVINENELIEKLEKVGFVCLELENISFAEQVELFSGCELLISLHGAALTNSIFMPLDAKVIELFPADHPKEELNACYFRLCGVLGQKHEFLWCEREFAARKFCLDTDNIRVNIKEIEKLLQ